MKKYRGLALPFVVTAALMPAAVKAEDKPPVSPPGPPIHRNPPPQQPPEKRPPVNPPPRRGPEKKPPVNPPAPERARPEHEGGGKK